MENGNSHFDGQGASGSAFQGGGNSPLQPPASEAAQRPRPPQGTWEPSQAPQGGGFAAAAPAKGGRVALIVVLALVALIVVGAASCTRSLVSAAGLTGTSDNAFSDDTVAVIAMDGTIQYDGSACSPEGLKNLLDQASENDNVKAVVLRVNSGGGTATAGEEMASYVRDFEKPIVVSSASMNASAAYEVSSQADYIFVAKTTEIGAIGTVMQVTDFSELLEKLGVDVDNIASADSKDSTYGTRPLTDDERQYYQDMIDEINSVFIDNVAKGRGLGQDEAAALATGLTFTGITAVGNGVADEIGTLEDACDKAAELAGCGDDYATADLSVSRDDVSALLDLISGYSSSRGVSAEDLALALKELEENDATIR